MLIVKDLFFLLPNLFYGKVKCDCGHISPRRKIISVFGEKHPLSFKGKDNPELCPDCWAGMAIKCAWCGKPIMPFDPITLYSPKNPDSFEIPEHAAIYSENPLRLVGCLRWKGCCPFSYLYRSGFWVPPGKVERVLSPIEKCLLNSEVTITEDISDMSEATIIQE